MLANARKDHYNLLPSLWFVARSLTITHYCHPSVRLLPSIILVHVVSSPPCCNVIPLSVYVQSSSISDDHQLLCPLLWYGFACWEVVWAHPVLGMGFVHMQKPVPPSTSNLISYSVGDDLRPSCMSGVVCTTWICEIKFHLCRSLRSWRDFARECFCFGIAKRWTRVAKPWEDWWRVQLNWEFHSQLRRSRIPSRP